VKFDWPHAAAFVARLCLSTIFMVSGIGKLMSPVATIGEIRSAGLPLPELGLAVAAAIELLCGGALLIGYRVRWAASILAIFSVATAVFFHASFADPNQFTHFLKNIAIAGGLLQVVIQEKSRSC
jgi:putative oxidoreductase